MFIDAWYTLRMCVYIMLPSQNTSKEGLNLLLKLFQLCYIKRLIPANVDQNLDSPIEF